MPLSVEAKGHLKQFFNQSFLSRSQMYEVFIEQLDAIYWQGYAEQLANDNPEKFNFELTQFFNIY